MWREMRSSPSSRAGGRGAHSVSSSVELLRGERGGACNDGHHLADWVQEEVALGAAAQVELVAHDALLRVPDGRLPRPVRHPLSQHLMHEPHEDLSFRCSMLLHATTRSRSLYLAKAIRVDVPQLQEVLHRVDVVGGELPVEHAVLADLLQPPYLVAQSWWMMLLVCCRYTVHQFVPCTSSSEVDEDSELTFSSVILNLERLRHGFSNPWSGVAPGHSSCTDLELATLRPARIISEA